MTTRAPAAVAPEELAPLIGPGTRVELAQLTIGPLEHGEHEVGTADGWVYLGLPAVGVDALRRLGAGLTIGEAVAQAADDGHRDLDVAGFVSALAGHGFVVAVDNGPGGGRVEVRPPERDERPSQAAFGEWTPLRRMLSVEAMARFGTPPWRRAWLLMALLLAVAVPSWFAAFPQSFPSPGDVWIGGSVDALLNWALFSVIAWLLVFLHEMGHVLAMRGLGEEASLSISHRLFYLVVQTNMRRARALPRRLRYAPYLSGMVVDLAVLLAAAIAYEATGRRRAPLAGIAYLELFGLTWQCAVFMRTDLYFVLTNALAVGDLMGTMRLALAEPWRRRRGRPSPELAQVPLRERRLASGYAVLCVAGFSLVAWAMATMNYPLMLRFALSTRSALATGPAHLAFWSATAFLAVIALYWGTFALVALRWVRRVSAGHAGGRPGTTSPL